MYIVYLIIFIPNSLSFCAPCLYNVGIKLILIDTDAEHMRAAKEALHVSTAPATVLCREEEQRRVLEFCKACVEQEKAGSLYVCGCPGTGKSLSMEIVKQLLVDWAKEVKLFSFLYLFL